MDYSLEKKLYKKIFKTHLKFDYYFSNQILFFWKDYLIIFLV